MGRIIGIDLGTTTSEIAYIKNGKPEIIINDVEERITPSVVQVDKDDDFVVGKYAKAKAALNPNTTVMEVKRLMGTEQKVKLGNKDYLPEEISSIILKKLKKYAEDFLCEEVTEAVITVPANFNEFQRRATQKAGEMAGLKVERIINEPTAAALAYGINNLQNDEKVLVYDLGGGTFDVTVLELFNGILDVKASRGNNKLGGKDFDERIEKYLINDFKEKYGIDLSENEMCLSRIKEVSEKAKIELSTLKETEITIPFIALDKNGKPLSLNVKLTRDKFEELIADLVISTKNQIESAIKAAKYDMVDIDVVLAVGGSSRIPCVKELLKSIFNDKVKTSINPDEAVALGASIQAGIKNDEISSENSVVLTDVCSHTLGIELAGGLFSPIIMRDTKVPCVRTEPYITASDDQTSVFVQIYQGEGKFAMENLKLKEFEVTGIPPAPAGKEKVDIQFKYNLNNMIEVTVKILSTGEEFYEKVDIMNTGKIFNESTYDRKYENDESDNQYKNSSQSNGNNNTSRLEALAKGTMQLAANKLEKAKPEDAEKIRLLLKQLKKAIIAGDEKLVEKYDDELTDLLFDLV